MLKGAEVMEGRCGLVRKRDGGLWMVGWLDGNFGLGMVGGRIGERGGHVRGVRVREGNVVLGLWECSMGW